GFALLDAPSGPARSAEEVASRALRWVSSAPEPDRPFFLLVHLFDPHMPYAPPAAYAPASAAGEGTLAEVSWAGLVSLARASDGQLSRAVLDRARALYDGEIAYTDHWFGRLLD